MRHLSRIVAGWLLAIAGGAGLAQAAPARVVLPIDGYYDRQTVKQFGTYVDQAFLANHPNEFRDNGYPKFTGYHAAADVDYTAPDQQNRDIEVRAIAAGTVVYQASVTGYGGVIVIRHQPPDLPDTITSLYGHVRLSDSPVKVGQTVAAGQPIANLGTAFGPETGGERRHLHFGIHRGTELDLAGHEPTQAVLTSQWDDPNVWLRDHGASSSAVPIASGSPVVISQSPVPSATPASEPKRGLLSRLWHALTDWLSRNQE